jgi:hypothetical protein
MDAYTTPVIHINGVESFSIGQVIAWQEIHCRVHKTPGPDRIVKQDGSSGEDSGVDYPEIRGSPWPTQTTAEIKKKT